MGKKDAYVWHEEITKIMTKTGMMAWIFTLASKLFDDTFMRYIWSGQWKNAAISITMTWFGFFVFWCFIISSVNVLLGEKPIFERLGRFKDAFVATVVLCLFTADSEGVSFWAWNGMI